MRHLIFFAYLMDIIIGVIGITIILLAPEERKTNLHLSLRNFMVLLFLMSIYDVMIYYTDYIIRDVHFDVLLRFGNCFIAVILYFWIDLAEKLVDTSSYQKLKAACKNYVLFFLGIWFLCTYAFSNQYDDTVRWVLLVSDVGLMLLFFTSCVVYLGEAVWSRKENLIVYYLILVSAMLLWNYTSYFWGEASTYWGNSAFMREPLDLTILFWCIANMATLYIIYKVNLHSRGTSGEEHKELDIDEKLEMVAKEYVLTVREKELAALIYEGKSNAEIASLLYISESTVKTHIYNIFRKMDVKNRIQLVCLMRGRGRT